MSRFKLFFLSLLTFFITACSHDTFLVHNGNMPAQEKIDLVKAGQTKEQVEQILGTPSSVTTLDGDTYIYMSSTVRKIAFCNPEVLERDVLTIHFNHEGLVDKISALDETDEQQIEIDQAQTETVGHKIGFFKKYFGGVGTYTPIAPNSKN